jgi:curved DNA-binding protein CbpA
VRTPKPVADRRDLRSAPLSPTDGFVLSRVDGVLSETAIAALTGLPDEQVQGSLAKLESLGLITFDGAARSSAPTHVSSTQLRAAIAGTPRSDPPLTAEEEVIFGEDAELEPEIRRRVLLTYRTLDELDHYTLLGVDKAADRKAIKRAYYDLAARFHPDKYFRKRLGSYKLRMETIFGRITQAHDTLTSAEKRAEYDTYLDEQRRARGIEELLADALDEVKRATETIEREVRAQEAAGASTSSAPPAAPSPSVGVSARRDALARRLLGGRSMPAPSPSAPAPAKTPSAPSVPSTADAMGALRRRYEERLSKAKQAQARKYIANGEAALAAGDAVAAATAFRIAKTLSPEDAELELLAKDAQDRADVILAETYTRQADYEEKNGQWREAARSWARVCKARPDDARAHERAADALSKAGTDLHEASRLAQRACTLEPQNPQYRVTLASVYLAAGLALNARRELETAAQLAPHDGTIQAMLKRVGKSA